MCSKPTQLEEQLRLLSLAIEQSSEGIAVVDMNGDLQYLNKTFAEMHGYTTEELIGRNLSIFHTPEQMDSVNSANKQIKETGEFKGEIWHVRRDGTVFPTLMHNSIIKDDTGKPIGMTGTIRDITEHKLMEKELKESEERLQIAGKLAFDLIYEWSVADDNLIWLGDIEAALGYEPGTIDDTIEGWIKLIHPDDRQGLNNAVEFHRTSIEPISYAYRVLHGNGSWRYWSDKAMPQLNDKGLPQKWIGVCTDITEQKEREEDQQKLITLIETSRDFIGMASLEGEVLYLNRAGQELAGINDGQIKSTRIQDYMNATGKDIIENEAIPRVISTGSWEGDGLLYNYETMAEIPVDITLFLINHPSTGVSLCLAIVMRDVTERKKVEKEKERLEVQLRQSQKMESLGTLAGGIAHDFNNILSAIIGFTEVSMYDVSEGSTLEMHLKEILKSSIRAADLVEQILTFSRRTEQVCQPVIIKDVVTEAVKLLKASLPSSIEIREKVDSESAIMADPTQIHQVFINLCTNAAYAMEEKGGILEICVVDVDLDEKIVAQPHKLKPGQYIKLTVSDTGKGIHPEIRNRIFDPYFTTNKLGKGTGLGLSVVHGIISSLGGSIVVESEPDEGTVFNVLLPVAENTSPAREEDYKGQNERILFVDDEPALTRSSELLLDSLGYKVVTASGSIEAFEIFRSGPDNFDIVITDATMPGMPGIELSKELLKIRPDIPIIICTGHGHLISEVHIREVGIKELLKKPVNKERLAVTIRKVLNENN